MTHPKVTAPLADGPTEIFDIAVFEAEDTAEMTVCHPGTGAPSTWKILFAGPGHPVTIAHNEAVARRGLREARDQAQTRANGKKVKIEEQTPEDIRQSNAEHFTARMLSWTPVKIRGEDYPFSRENAMLLLLDRRKFGLYNQIIEFLKDDDAFMKSSATA
jgi:hypothetical protein